MIAGHLSRHMKTHTKTQSILQNLKKDQEHFNRVKETGQIVEALLKHRDIDPRSLRREYSEALEITDAPDEITETLRSWQRNQ